MTDRIHLSKADVTELEEEYVLRALRSGWVAPLGPDVDAFEQEVAERAGVAHALGLSSGTAALHLALLGLGVQPGDTVVVPTMTFAASAMPVIYAGAAPYFVDCLPDGNVEPELFLEAVDVLQRRGKRVAAAISVDLFGRAADYDTFAPGLHERGVPLLEDAAEALGATFRSRPAGSFGTAAALSFNGNKIITASGGGMLLSDDEGLVERARYLSAQARQPVPYYQHVDVGYNYRLSNILAALGRAQLSRLDTMIARRRAIRDMYIDGLSDVPSVEFLGRGTARGDNEDNCWLTCVVLDRSISASPDTLVSELGKQGIEVRHLWKPMHLQPVFEGCESLLNGTSEHLFDRGLALPSGSALRDDDIDRVIAALRRALDA